MEIKTLEGVDTKEILHVFNVSFSDYFVPFKLTEVQLTLKMLADKTDLSLSVGVFENQKLIAFILHGFGNINGQKVVYNGGTGVIPEKRGSGLTKQMYGFILPLLIEKEIDKVILEVISINAPAISSYKKSGFTIKRELVCYKGTIKTLQTNKNIVIKRLQSYDWNLMKSFWDVFPTWQNATHVLDTLKQNNISLGVYIRDKLVGYVIYNPKSKRMQQIAVHKKYRKQNIASTLLLELIEEYGNSLSIINVDKSSRSVNNFFNTVGLKNNLEQLEMELVLNGNNSN